MSTLIAEVCSVNDILAHPNADKLEIAQVKGWECVSQKGQFSKGGKCIYLPPDTCINTENAEKLNIATKYLVPLPDKTGFRIRVTSLRGVKSFGLILPCPQDWEVGFSVIEQYSLFKWDPPIKCRDGDALRDHVNFPRYTELEHFANFPDILTEGEEVIITEKLHGCFHHTTKILLADGNTKDIGDIVDNKLPVKVLSYNFKEKKTEEKEITNWYNNGYSIDFLKINDCICTKKHLFYTSEGYVEAENLKLGHTLIGNNTTHEVHSIQKFRGQHIKYDLEVMDNSNYFANGYLVHNSNARVGIIRAPDEQGDEKYIFMVGSHNVRRKEFFTVKKSERNPYTKDLIRGEDGNPIVTTSEARCKYWNCLTPEVKQLLTSICEEKNDVIVYGEMLGTQDMKYGLETGFRAFDLMINGKYVDYDVKKDLFDKFGVPMVPILFKGPFKKELIKQFVDGPTTMCASEKAGDFKGREGIVIIPCIERNVHKVGRIIFKSVSFDYLNRKNGTEEH